MTQTSTQPAKPGRPPKFEEPSRPVTVTLPESTLQRLEAIDEDRGRAIVKLAGDAPIKGRKSAPHVEIAAIGPGSGIIIVGPSRELRKIPFLDLIEVAPSRYLLVLQAGHDFKALELTLSDALDGNGQIAETERVLLTELIDILRSLRRGARVSTANILLVDLPKKMSATVSQALLYSGGTFLAWAESAGMLSL